MKRLILTIALLITLLCANASDYLQYADSADRCIAREDWAKAATYLESALQPANPSNALLLSNLGVVRTRLGEYDAALQAFDAGLGISPRSTTLLTNRARTLIESNQPVKAHQDLTKALEVDSTLQTPRYLRTIIDIHLGYAEQAYADSKRLVTQDPGNTDYLEAAAVCAEMMGEKPYAIELMERAHAIAPDNADFAVGLAHLLLQENQLERATELLQTAIKQHPGNGNLYLLRALLHKKTYQPRLQEADLKLAMQNGADYQLLQSLFPEHAKKK